MRRSSIAFSLMLLAWPEDAFAMKNPDPAYAAGFGRPQAEGLEGIVRAEEVRFTCDDSPRCEVVARWLLAPTGAATTLRIGIEFADVEELMLEGTPLDHRVTQDDRSWTRGGWRVQPSVIADLPADSRERMLVARIQLLPRFATRPWPSMVQARHVFVHRHPECTTVWYGAPHDQVRRSVALERTKGLRRRQSRVVEDVEEFPLCRGRMWHGGPLLGIGASFEPRARLLLRAGYELSSSRFTVHGLAMETDIRRVLVVPYTDVGSPNVFLIAPSVALGLGAPLRVWPDFRAGVRLQLTLSWPIVSLVGAFDAFPRMRDEPTVYYGAFLTQFSF
jgi:hypothetical protein